MIMSKAVPALFLAFVAVVLCYAFAHRQGPPKPATELRIETTMVMSAAQAGAARVAVGERGRIFPLAIIGKAAVEIGDRLRVDRLGRHQRHRRALRPPRHRPRDV